MSRLCKRSIDSKRGFWLFARLPAEIQLLVAQEFAYSLSERCFNKEYPSDFQCRPKRAQRRLYKAMRINSVFYTAVRPVLYRSVVLRDRKQFLWFSARLSAEADLLRFVFEIFLETEVWEWFRPQAKGGGDSPDADDEEESKYLTEQLLTFVDASVSRMPKIQHICIVLQDCFNASDMQVSLTPLTVLLIKLDISFDLFGKPSTMLLHHCSTRSQTHQMPGRSLKAIRAPIFMDEPFLLCFQDGLFLTRLEDDRLDFPFHPHIQNLTIVCQDLDLNLTDDLIPQSLHGLCEQLQCLRIRGCWPREDDDVEWNDLSVSALSDALSHCHNLRTFTLEPIFCAWKEEAKAFWTALPSTLIHLKLTIGNISFLEPLYCPLRTSIPSRRKILPNLVSFECNLKLWDKVGNDEYFYHIDESCIEDDDFLKYWDTSGIWEEKDAEEVDWTETWEASMESASDHFMYCLLGLLAYHRIECTGLGHAGNRKRQLVTDHFPPIHRNQD